MCSNPSDTLTIYTRARGDICGLLSRLVANGQLELPIQLTETVRTGAGQHVPDVTQRPAHAVRTETVQALHDR
jgi:hypothetical protein